MLIDGVIPVADHAHREQMLAPAGIERVYAQARHADFSHSRVTRVLYALRGLRTFPTSIDGMLDFGFTLLGEQPPSEFVLGLAGQFWKPSGGPIALRPDEFAGFDREGYAIVVWNFHLSAVDASTTLMVTESRVRAHGHGAKAAMRVYWTIIAPFSRLIRREILRSIVARL